MKECYVSRRFIHFKQTSRPTDQLTRYLVLQSLFFFNPKSLNERLEQVLAVVIFLFQKVKGKCWKNLLCLHRDFRIARHMEEPAKFTMEEGGVAIMFVGGNPRFYFSSTSTLTDTNIIRI